MKKENKNNKKIISIIVALVFVVTIVFVLARPNLLRRTTGNVSGADETLVVGTADYTEMCKYYNEALKLNLSDYSNTSDLEDALLNLDWDLTEEDQAKVDSETKALKDALAGLKKDSKSSDSNTTTASSKSSTRKKAVRSKKTTTEITTATTTQTTTKKIINKIVKTTRAKEDSNNKKLIIIPIVLVVMMMVGFVAYKSKKEK